MKKAQIQSRNPLLNDGVILLLIILNTATIWWQFSECAPEWLTIVDAADFGDDHPGISAITTHLS